MKVTRRVADTRAALAELPRPLALVPTMGALHEGHLSLLRAARAWAGPAGSVVMSLFVNPTQFGPDEDYARYPRSAAHDLELAQREGADLVFAPQARDMYPDGFATTVHVGGPLTESLEGAMRARHFDGVATVVTKLLTIIRPEAAFFGRKDAQQFAVIRRLNDDLNLGVEVVGCATVREPDGLAMSSRNRYLSAAERAAAPRLYQALQAGRAAAARGGATPQSVVQTVTHALSGGVSDDNAQGASGAPTSVRAAAQADAAARASVGPPASAAPRFTIDYVAVVDPDTFVPERDLRPASLVVAAARLGATRLIDNLVVGLRAGRAADGKDTHAGEQAERRRPASADARPASDDERSARQAMPRSCGARGRMSNEQATGQAAPRGRGARGPVLKKG